MTRHRAAWLATCFLVFALSLSSGAVPDGRAQSAGTPPSSGELRQRAVRDGRVRVIVELKLASGAHVPEGRAANAASVGAQRQAITAAGARVLGRLRPAGHRLIHRYQSVPYLVLDVSAADLQTLETATADVVRVMDDPIVRPVLAQSVPLIEGDQAWASGYDGSGMTIAVVDTGVDVQHPFLAGKVIEEACYSSTVAGVSRSVCPNGLDEQLGVGAGVPCALAECVHGTHVAGIAAGNGATAGQSFSGVAKGARVMSVQVFSEILSSLNCGGTAPCAGAFTSDIIAGLERVYAIAATRPIAAVNMSLGGGGFSAPCDGQPYKPIIDNLRSIGVATVVAAGNSGSTSSLSAPACVSSAISVGSTDKNDVVSWFSNVASFMSLFAPGEAILSSVPGGTYQVFNGTSMAAPHVAGAWAILRQAAPGASVSTILSALRQTGLPITDTRMGGTETAPRVRIFHALAEFFPVTNPSPSAASLSPSHVRAGNAATLTVTGSGFDGFSVLQWNGATRPTTVLSTTQIRGAITAADVAAAGTGLVSVFTPAPGGGTSNALPLTIDPPPTLTVSAATVAPNSPATVTLSNGLGGATDWLALAAAGSPDTSYVLWTYVGAGVTERPWTITMPSTAGVYEFRLFPDNGSVRAATSAPITVDSTFRPFPVVASMVPARVLFGSVAFTLTVNGSNFSSSSVVRWNGSARPTTFVSGSQLQAAIAAEDVAAVSSAQVTVFTPSPGGGTSSALPFAISPPPTLTASAASAPAGGMVTATLTGGLGGQADWLALAATTAANSSYVQYVYIGTGVFDRTWTVAMPSTPGTYEFRLFLNGGYTRSATSPTITVAPGPSPVPGLSSLVPASAPAGAAAFSLTLNGSGFVASSIVRWNGADRATTLVSATQLRAAISAADLATAGTAQISIFTPSPGGGTSPPLPFSIVNATASLSVSATSVAPGAAATVTLSNGLGGATDWLALAASGAPDTSYLQWTYVGAGVSTRSWTVTMPATPGAYEFRLFLNNGSTRVASSPAVSVVAGPSPVPVLTSVSPAGSAAGAAAFTLTVNGSAFVSSSVVRWNGSDRVTTFVNGTQLRAAIPATDVAAAGTAQVTVVSPAPGDGVSAALPFTVGLSPTLTVNVATAAPGATVTVTLTNGFGGATDWMALAATSAPDTNYVRYTYIGAGLTTRTWTVTMPATPGTYEFRLYPNNGYTRAAVSPVVTVVSQ